MYENMHSSSWISLHFFRGHLHEGYKKKYRSYHLLCRFLYLKAHITYFTQADSRYFFLTHTGHTMILHANMNKQNRYMHGFQEIRNKKYVQITSGSTWNRKIHLFLKPRYYSHHHRLYFTACQLVRIIWMFVSHSIYFEVYHIWIRVNIHVYSSC